MNPERSETSRLYEEFSEATKRMETNPIAKPELKHPGLRSQLNQIKQDLEILAEEEQDFVQQIEQGIPREKQNRLLELTERSGNLFLEMFGTIDALFGAYDSEQGLLAERIEELNRQRQQLDKVRQQIEPYTQMFTSGTEDARKFEVLKAHQRALAHELIETYRMVSELDSSRKEEREAFSQHVPFQADWHKRNLALRNASYQIRNQQTSESSSPEEPGIESA
jgi:hypothetical protein